MRDIKPTNPYRVPDNYFDHLEQSILETNFSTKKRKLSLGPLLVAASVILLAVTLYYTLYQTNSSFVDAKKEELVYNRLFDLFIVEDYKNKPNEMENEKLQEFYSDDLLVVMD